MTSFFFIRYQNIFVVNTFYKNNENQRTTVPAEVRKKALPFVQERYIRTFDVISELWCFLLRRRRIKKALSSVSANMKSFLKVFRARKAFLDVLKMFSEIFIKTSWAFRKLCAFYSADFRRSLLVFVISTFKLLYFSFRENHTRLKSPVFGFYSTVRFSRISNKPRTALVGAISMAQK